MCGILYQLCYGCSPSFQDKDKILQWINNRGPDHKQSVELQLLCFGTSYFHAAVLWMHGPQITPQPVENESGILMFNGDIFDEQWANEISDTQSLLNILSQNSELIREDYIVSVIRSLKGPFALVYQDKLSEMVYFSRDRIGRSSLLFHCDDENRLTISSVLGRSYDCFEVPSSNIFSYNIKVKLLQKFSWTEYYGPDVLNIEDWLEEMSEKQSLPDDGLHFDFDYNMDLNDSENIIEFMETTAKEETDKLTVMKKLMTHDSIREVVLNITDLLEASVKIRIEKQPNKCKDCVINNTDQCNHCTVGVLFSGGLDCTILALLADKYLPENQEIDLINVAFGKSDSDTFDVPDRLTGRQSYEELKKQCPSRIWNLKEVNVTPQELQEFQASTIADLVYPRKTILDESLGSALWFAARGKDTNSTSTCRVLLLGSGADELFGGYTRHRNAYKRGGWIGLAKELMFDWNRISVRNLSRDNRVICDHGRQPRMPYLDEDFSDYILKLKPWFKCFPSDALGPGIGDKLMLRLVARNLGLSQAATFPKRALQFGSRIANKKENGADISKSFLA